ncbi:hypothetical protein myaer102_40390 [Microcystis viridis NIES-102]|uniref:Methyltransferase FkbM domain-containing protein n=1 Tax=Microcystis viridis NIES-102 TaxID=213615 RepID=A0A3G9JLT2_MICVR|nr:FkbM family methyltransferase [Microcystis viridis]BBH41426.1 hypothetical protein myaer102_40390 [Microcystis viridis NIES-102]
MSFIDRKICFVTLAVGKKYRDHALTLAEDIRTIKVTKCRLDTFLKREVQNYSALKIFLKMDTQGYDLKVFAGLGDAVGSIVALQSEISVIPIYRQMPHLTESINCFEREGFSIAGLFPVSREKSLRVIEYDCLMVRI